jgi:hypothetical protein
MKIANILAIAGLPLVLTTFAWAANCDVTDSGLTVRAQKFAVKVAFQEDQKISQTLGMPPRITDFSGAINGGWSMNFSSHDVEFLQVKAVSAIDPGSSVTAVLECGKDGQDFVAQTLVITSNGSDMVTTGTFKLN